jgi:hypothetical protein
MGAIAALLGGAIACSDDGQTDSPFDQGADSQNDKKDAMPGPESPKEDDKPAEQPPAETPATPGTVEADVDTIAWQQGADVGNGVASKDTGNPRGNSIALIYGGYQSSLDGVKGWTTALYKATLKDRGVRHIFAIQGPADVQYTAKEIGNTKISAALLPKIDDKTKFILLFGHSSGSYVAHEFLQQVASGRDPDGKMNDKLVYFNLDGGYRYFTAAIGAKVKKTYWVSPRAGQLTGFNAGDMQLGANTYKNKGGLILFDASGAGCTSNGCAHDSLLISKPHNPGGATPGKDYDDYSGGRTVVTKFVADKAAEAGLDL